MNKPESLKELSVEALEQQLSVAQDADAVTALSIELCLRFQHTNPAKAVEICRRAIPIAQKQLDTTNCAKLMNMAGSSCHLSGQYIQAMNYYKDALALNQKAERLQYQAINTGNIGVIYYEFGDYALAAEYFLEAFNLNMKTGNVRSASANMGNLAALELEMGDYVKAEEYLNREEAMLKDLEDANGMTIVTVNRANVAILKKDYEHAIELLKSCIAQHQEAGTPQNASSCWGNLGYVYSLMGQWDLALAGCTESLRLDLETGREKAAAIQYIRLGELYANKQTPFYDITIAEDYFLKGLEITGKLGLKRQKYDGHQKLSDLYRDIEKWKESAEHYRLFHELEKELKHDEMEKRITSFEMQRKLELKEKENEITISVLHNVLPAQIAERIKNGEEKIVERFDNATVLFADIVDFTVWSKDRDVTEVAERLNKIFHLFDDLAIHYRVEKIKTIGDAYMCVAGLPEPCDDHAERIARMALAMKERIRQAFEDNEIQLRIGIHTGEVIAGVLGKNKYSYDLWGDTVNTASRMESHGVPGKIQVTKDVKELLHHKYDFEEREPIEVKGKGKMALYFLVQ